MKMVMSADSSDCHPSSSSVVVGAEAPSTSAKISVICHMSQQLQQHQQQTQSQQPQQPSSVDNLNQSHSFSQQQHHLNVVEASPASSTTSGPQIVMGRSHLENALKLPPNTSVSSYYQNTKLLSHPIEEENSPNCVIYQPTVKQEFNAPTQSNQRNLTYSRSTTAAPVTDMDTVPTGAVAAAAAPLASSTNINVSHIKLSPSPPCPSSSSNNNSSNPSVIYNNPHKPLNSLILSQALQQPSNNINNNNNNSYQSQHHSNNIVSTTESHNPQHHAHHHSLGSPYDSFGHTNGLSSSSSASSSTYHQSASNGVVNLHHALPPTPNNSMYLHTHQQQQQQQSQLQQQQHLHPHHSGANGQAVMVVAADSRPQTPDYIKSYPVMDTTVASSMKGEPELNIEFDGTTVLCRVCGDKASGFHYGVHSCEGCKGFFRRSIQQKIQYRPCTKNQQCSILRINRNRCQYCRLKKCIAVGMSRDAVRFGRVPKREKARILAAMQQSTQNRGQQRALASELDDQPRLLSAVLRAHLDTCEFTKEKVAAMRQRARECPSYSMPTLLACPLNPAPELQSEQEFSQRFAHVIRGVIDFAGMIPGFQLLSQDDKFTLLKAGLFDALFVRLICMFDNSINSIICLNGQVMRRDAIQNGANARFLVDSTFNFAERMNSMNLTDAEIGLFCAIVLITPDRPGLRNIELIERMYNRLKGCLQTIINQNRPDQPEFMSKLLETMPDLRTLSTLHTEKLVVFRTEHKELLRQQMWSMDDDQQILSKSPNSWDEHRMDVEAKSPLGSVSSTESGDLEYQTATTTTSSLHHNHHGQQTSSLASSAPLLAATLSGTCPLRNRANSGSSGDSTNDLDIVGSHAHLTQNGLTITPIVRAHSHQQLHHHLTSGSTQHRYRKLDSPTDSGIESGNEKNECGSKNVSSGGSSSCSSPRSSVDDALDCSENAAAANSSSQVTVSVSPVRSPQPLTAAATSTSNSTSSSSSAAAAAASSVTLKRQIVDDMPVLKRVLQAPPLYDTNSLMDEAYKPHKKFRALRHREYECGEADASSSTNNANATSTSSSCIPAAASSPQLVNAQSPPPPQQQQHQQHMPSVATVAATNSAQNNPVLMVPQATHSPQTVASPPAIAQHQSQLHMHLTRPTPTNSNSGANHQQPSSLSSTHSVLAKSLMAEPRMTPEQMKRSDIIQNYIMRESSTAAATAASSSNNLMVCSPNGPGSRSPAPGVVHSLTQHGLYPAASNSPNSSSSPNSNCNSPSTTTVTALSSPPVGGGRWPGHSVITTTTINQRQQSVSPSSNGSSSSSTSSSASSSSTSSSTGCQYFQSPHSTSASVSPPRPSPSAMNTPPRLLELQVDIADSQQPLNLSKKSPTPPPSKLQALMAAATAAQRYPTVSADVTVTATTANGAAAVVNSSTPAQQHQVQKVMLEA